MAVTGITFETIAEALGVSRSCPFISTNRLHALFFLAAHRLFMPSEIRLLAAALKRRPDGLPGLRRAPPVNASIASLRRSRSFSNLAMISSLFIRLLL
jgi:hypothetical protein